MVKGSDLVRYEALFRKEYAMAAAAIDRTNLWALLATIGTPLPSTGVGNDYRWFGSLPEFEEWVGDRNLSDLSEYNYTILNKDFQAAVRIDKNDLNDDSLGMIMTRIRDLPTGVERKWGKLMHELLINGTTNKAFDGVAFFSDVSGVRLNDNLLAGTISAGTPTIGQVEADIDTVRTAMAAFKNENGEPLGIMPDVYIVHPKLERFFKMVFESTSAVSGSNSGVANWANGMGRVIVDPALTDVNDFYALCTSYSVGPFVKQNRQNVETVLDDTQVNINKAYFFGADFRGNAGYAFPILAAKVVSAVA